MTANQLDKVMQSASEGKENFINFVREIEIIQEYPWVEGWLQKFWSDKCSQVFFKDWFNGALDYDILDDIEACMKAA